MDAYNINAQTPEEKQETGHALAIVGYVMPKDGDKNKHLIMKFGIHGGKLLSIFQLMHKLFALEV